MRAWLLLRSGQLSHIPRPLDEPRAYAEGVDPDRILIFGTGPAAGWGVTTHSLSLPGALARSLIKRTGRGADVQVVTGPSMTLAHPLPIPTSPDLRRFDSVIVVLGVDDAIRMTRPTLWARHLRQLLVDISTAVPRDAPILVTGIQPIRSIPPFDALPGSVAASHARALNTLTRRVCQEFDAVHFVDLPGAPVSPDRHRDPAGYERWGEVIAECLAPELNAVVASDESSQRAAADFSPSELSRQAMIDALDLSSGNERFDAIVEVARTALNTSFAAFSVIDGDIQRNKSILGIDTREIPREVTFCSRTIHSRDVLVIPDATQDPRFADNPFVVAEPFVRFYAGVPIEAPSGERIGALCVLDIIPRTLSHAELRVLQRLGHALQTAVWQVAAVETAGQVPRLAI